MNCRMFFQLGYNRESMGNKDPLPDYLCPDTKEQRNAYGNGVLLAIQHREEFMREFNKQSEE